MRCRLDTSILLLHPDDVPTYKKGGSVVRNSYFWALRSIADASRLGQPWEFHEAVWLALVRMLLSFAGSGYLGDRETLLEFPPNDTIPDALRDISTWASHEVTWDTE